MTQTIPVLLFAFANDRQDGNRHLSGIADERRAIEAALDLAVRRQLCELKILPGATLDEIKNTIQDERYRNRIAVFHYGGHAGSFDLLLEKNDRENKAAHRDGLVPLLQSVKSLQLVFLNGCNTEQWAHQLNDAGIPLVAGTFQAIHDDAARQLAASFYNGLAQGLPIRRSWNDATAHVVAGNHSNLRSVGFDNTNLDRFPWELFERRGADLAAQWNLPDATGNPLLAIPLPDTYQQAPLPNEPFRFLDRYRKNDAAVFFGRGHDIRNLYDRLTDQGGSPVLLLTGQSGVGKSSMLEAGLMPRLEDSCTMLYARREVEAGLLGTLEKHLAEKCGVGAPAGLMGCWKQLEQQHGKPLIVVLDQTEEAYTRGVGDREMEQLAVALDQVFGERNNSPKGKIVLGFRKEYEGEITQALKQYKVDFATVFLQRLSAQGIAEVVNGLASTEALRKKYSLQIDPALAATIATDLLADSDTPVSPVLQIILTKLWETRGQERSFTVEKFLQLKEDGIYLGDFFRQQMTSLHEWEKRTGKDVESSGLALDVLNSHTTDLGFANSRSLDEIRALYHHRKDVIDELIKQFKELYLLTDAGETRNALAHDTLAPVVLHEVQKSDRPAQKALRILASKMANFGKNTANTYLDATDLALVEHGEKSMRIWKDQEPELVKKSRERRTTLRRQRWLAAGAIALLAVAAGWFAFNSYQSGRIEKWVSQARFEAGADPTIAMNTLQRAAKAAPGNAAILAAMRDIWSENEFYYQKTTFNAPVLGTLYAPDTTGNWYAWTEKCLYRGNRQGMLLDSFPATDIEAVALQPGGNALFVSTRDGQLARVHAATLRQESASRPFAPEYATHLIYSNDGNTLFAAISNGQLAAIATQDSRILFTRPLDAAVSALDIHPYQNNLLIGFANGEAGTYTLQGQLQTVLPGHRDQVLAFAVSPVDSSITTAGRDAQIIFRYKNGNNRLTIKGHDRRINTLRWAADGQRLLSAGNDYVVKSWSNEGDLIAVYRAHTAFVNQLDLSPDGQHVITAGQDRVVRLWKVESKVTHRFGPHPAGVSGIRPTPDGKQVITTTEAGLNAIGETLNDQDFDFDALLDLQFGQTPRTAMVWDVASGNPLQTWKGHTGGINALDSDATGQSWVTASDDTTARIWSRAGALQKTLKSTGKIMAAALAPDGKMAVTATDEGQLTLWNQDATVMKTIHQESLLRTVAFAANGQYFATGSYDGMVRIYDASGVEKFTIQMPGNQRVECVCFTPDGQSVLVGTWGNTAGLYSLQGTVEAVFEVYSENKTGGKAIKSVAVSPDGKYLALGAEGGLVHVYQRTEGKPALTHHIQHHPKNAILSLRFSPDSKGILTGSGDGWGRWWTLQTF